MTNNTRNKNQCDDAIEYEPIFDSKFSLSSGPNRHPLSVVTVSLKGGRKYRAFIIYGLKCLWDSGSTAIIIKRRKTKPYKCTMLPNKVEYSTSIGPYCTVHNVKVIFCMPKFSTINIILHHFHVNINKGESGIGYDITIWRVLMVHIGPSEYFNHQALQWDGATLPIK